MGVYRYDGRKLVQFTVKDGLSNNQVQHIQEDKAGNIWFGTGVFGVSKFDGEHFITLTSKEKWQSGKSSESNWKIAPNDLWFYAGGGVYRYHDTSFMYLPFHTSAVNAKKSQGSPYELSSYAVYSILKDKKGNIWFGTQAMGVCRYDGKSFTWFTEKGLGGSAVLGLFEDSKGILWCGNNGGGLFKFDGKSLY
jgi:ligand-binding sensor domain-containing protein